MENTIKINLAKNQYPTFQEMISKLVEMSYRRVPMVLEPAEFSVRGAIIDIFSINHLQPIRIEYFDQEIERLTSFNIHTQTSIRSLNKTEIKNATNHKDVYSFNQLNIDENNENLLSSIEIDNYVVHEDYGIGQYKGLIRLNLAGKEGEYLFIQYKGKDKLYVPLEQINKVYNYSGSDIIPPLNSLSDKVWQKTKDKSKKALEELAEDIYIMYKTRQKIQGHKYNEDTLWQIDLERSFVHKDTPDQEKVTKEIKQDMESSKPMDRVLVGDVGYGKTEVVLRAAFKASENGKQTAIIVPTTILADQHFNTFSKRFKNYPHKVEMLSRFRSKSEQKAIIQELKTGKIKVIIGTHRLLQKDIVFQDLGLLIVDEEQRFGVTHKEKIKEMKKNVDVISISATPIPRTLYMALTGAKDFSIINTAPYSRKPVFTAIHTYSENIIKKAINNELNQKDQIFYLYNNVQKMNTKYTQLKKLFPTAKIGIGHGQMREKELENVIHDFINRKYDILLCTTIIENGVDIPNANTIIVENAHLFGLSQIHQIRGRVGRTSKQAYAYLLYPPAEHLSKKARQRLQAIKEYATLGSGYKLALKDLEIRGAGTLLGKKQHGHMTSIGFELYCKLLEESVQKIKKRTPIRPPNIFIEKDINASIPMSYIARERERLAIYRRFMTCIYKNQLIDLIKELEDRYGKIPKELKPLLNSIYDQLLDNN